MDRIGILLLTCGRMSLTIQSIAALNKYLEFDGDVVWYVADGGSTKEDHAQVMKYLSQEGQKVIGNHSVYFSAGHNWNKGTEFLYASGVDVLLRLENDFSLRYPLDISKYVDMMRRREDVGMVRLGLMPIDLDLASIGDIPGDSIYLEVTKRRQYTFSGNPCLIHQRFHRAYGMFGVDESPGLTEISMDNLVHAKDGPKIVFPWDMGGKGRWGYWHHNGTEKSIKDG